jgi:hypothetical protein
MGAVEKAMGIAMNVTAPLRFENFSLESYVG